MMHRRLIPLTVALFLAIGILAPPAGAQQPAVAPRALTGDERVDVDQFVHRIEQVQGMSRQRPVNVVYAAATAMVAALRDPNSVFYGPDAFAQFIRRTRGDDFVGVGIVIEDKSGQVVITDILDDSPASEAGLRPR